MPIHNYAAPKGTFVELVIESEALRGNLLGDPTARRVQVYLPQGYDQTDADYPVMLDLAGFVGSGLKRMAWTPFGENVPQRLDRLVAQRSMGPVIAVFPDCFTALGGNQYVDSVAMGRWEQFVLNDLLPRVDATFRVRKGAKHRAVYGKSSGGYGALIHGLRHGDAWGAIACHSGDIGFELCYLRDMPVTLDVLANHGRSVEAFVAHLKATQKIRGVEMHALMLLAMAATYDPDPSAPFGIRLPVDLDTCAVDPQRWNAWLAHDPLRLVDEESCQRSLRSLSGLFIDCGSRDQYFLHYGARALVAKLKLAGISCRYEEFADNHSSVDYRLDVSLPYLYRALTGESGESAAAP